MILAHDPNLDDGQNGWFRAITVAHPSIEGRQDRLIAALA
jgi:hypothetical protein